MSIFLILKNLYFSILWKANSFIAFFVWYNATVYGLDCFTVTDLYRKDMDK